MKKTINLSAAKIEGRQIRMYGRGGSYNPNRSSASYSLQPSWNELLDELIAFGESFRRGKESKLVCK